ncbi:MAG: PKD domain-containing protein [Planctomycetota bacterium]|nr:PKD domain-containing protein [Planctomycetota bacterium]
MNTSTAGVKTGTLTIVSNDVDTPSLVIPITGTVQAANTPPVANAGADQTLTDTNGSGNEPVTLNGAASSDPDGTIVLYRWTEGATQLSSGTASTANVTLAVGVHDIQLTVTDNANATASDTVRVTVNPRPNTPPTANAGGDQTVTDVDGSGTESVTLNGSGSSDSDGTITSYVWKEGATTIATGVSPSVALPVGVHTLLLTVTDNSNATATDTVIVTVNPRPNTPPAANAGSDLTVIDGDRSGSEDVQLDGTASTDADGTIVSYEWKEGVTTIATGSSPLVPFALGTHTVQLIVTDNNNATSSDTLIVTITAPCIADFNQDGGVDGTDVEAFFAAWEAGDAIADANEDGGVDGADIETFFTFWEAGGC